MPRLTVTFAAAIVLSLTLANSSAAQTVVISGTVPDREASEMPKGTGLVLGRAVEASDGTGVAGAIVTLRMLGGPALPQAALSDGQGRFVFRDLPAGRYWLIVTKPGYVSGTYGKHLPDTGLDVSNDWQPLVLADDEHRGDLVVKLWKHATISGIVRDERGEPVTGITVRAAGVSYAGGTRRYSVESGTAGAVPTDDRGMYRLSGLIPGEYLVVVPVVTQSMPRSLARLMASAPGQTPKNLTDSSAGNMTWNPGGGLTRQAFEGVEGPFTISMPIAPWPTIAGKSADGRLLFYEMQFYPGASQLERATPIVVGSGEERSGVDFALRAIPTSRISGKVIGPDGPAPDMTLNLVRGDSDGTSSDSSIAQTVSDADGTFVFIGIAPGEYTVRALVTPRPRLVLPAVVSTTVTTGAGTSSSITTDEGGRTLPSEPMLWASERVVLGEQDVRDVALTLRRGGRISGKVVLDGPPGKTLPSYLGSFYVERADGVQSKNLSLLLGAIDRQGNAASQGQAPGKYFVRVPQSGPPTSEWFFAGAMHNGRDLSVTPIEIGESDIEGVTFIFRNKPGAGISGVVRREGTSADFTAAVVVFPVNRSTWNASGRNPRDYRSVAVLSQGRYSVTDLPPGEYYVAPLPASRPDWRDAATLDTLSRIAVRVTVADGEQKTQDLTLPRRSAGDADVTLGEMEPGEGGPWAPEDQAQAPPPRDGRPAPPAGTGVLSGIVVTGEQREPVRRAVVQLTGPALLGTRAAITDDEGRFSFAGVPAGRFNLVAQKAAYLEAAYGASRQGRPGTPITIAEGERREGLILTMVRGGVITGIVRDANGEPIPNSPVQLMASRITGGARRLTPYASGPVAFWTTDDRGVYRFYGIEPGDYAVAANIQSAGLNPRETTPNDIRVAEQMLSATARVPGRQGGAAVTPAPAPPSPARAVAFVPIFYPGTADPSQARLITLRPGEEIGGIDLVYRPVPAATLRGTVTPAGTRDVEVRLVNATAVGFGPGFTNVLSLLPIRPDAEGRFTFSGVAPGTYALVATTRPAGGAGATPQFAITEIAVNGADIDGINLALQDGMTISGSISFDAKTLNPPEVSAIRISLAPILTGTQVSVGSTQTMVSGDGSFRITGVIPGQYQIRPFLPSGTTGWIPASAMLQGRDVYDTGFDLRPGESISGLRVTYTDQPAEVNGVLQDPSGRPAPDYFIILFPSDRSLWRSGARRIQQVRPGTDGRFIIRNLPAGTYRLAALTDVAPGEQFEPAFLEQLIPASLSLTLAQGERKTQDVLIRK